MAIRLRERLQAAGVAADENFIRLLEELDEQQKLLEEQRRQLVEVTQRLEAFEAQGAALNRRGEAQSLRAAELQEEEQRVRQAQSLLNETRAAVQRERAAVQRETHDLEQLRIEAQTGFANEEARALAGLRARRDELLHELESLEKAHDERIQAWEHAQGERRRQETQRRAQELERLEAELGQTREQARAQAQAQAREIEALARAQAERLIEQAEQTRTRLQQEQEREWGRREESLVQAQERQEANFAARDEALNERSMELSEQETRLNNREAAVEARLAYLEHQLQEERRFVEETQRQEREASKERLIDAQRRIVALEQERDSQQELLRRLGDRSPEEILKRQREDQQRIQDLRDELARRPSPEAQDELETLRRERNTLQGDRERLRRRLSELEVNQGSWTLNVARLEQERDLREAEEHRRRALQVQIEHLGREVDRLQGLYHNPAERGARASIIEQPIFNREALAPFGGAEDELKWLDGIHQKCQGSGLVFPERLLKAFHTSLKTSEWSPLTVLAGVSGTGKSALPEMYARFGGLLFQSMAVQPNWDSPQSIFGFFNSVDNLFDATPLLRAMFQMQAGDDHELACQDRMLIVLLDEMNLAHVELYFSEMLSRLEQRRGGSEIPAVEVSLGAGMEVYPIALQPNTLWVGTMNEDETTRSLSDKVIDRGNLLSFPRPRSLRRRLRASLAKPGPALRRSTWEKWQVDQSPFSDQEVQPFKEGLQEINEHLSHVGRAVGHRVWQAAEHYMANHPDVLAAGRGSDGDEAATDRTRLERAMRSAFEDAVVHKVMPKLRGIETSGRSRSHCLDPIAQTLQKLNLQLSEDFERACNTPYGAFAWSSANYLSGGLEDV